MSTRTQHVLHMYWTGNTLGRTKAASVGPQIIHIKEDQNCETQGGKNHY